MRIKCILLNGLFICFFQLADGMNYCGCSGLSGINVLLLRIDIQTEDLEALTGIGDTTLNSEEEEKNVVHELPVNETGSLSTEEAIDSLSYASVKEVVSAQKIKIPFYKMWWFSLLIVIVISVPFLRRYYLNTKQRYIEGFDEKNQKIKILEEKLKESEESFNRFREEEEDKVSAGKELRFQVDGIARFSDLIAKNKSNTSILGQTIISELVEFIGANSGAIYLIKEENGEEPHLEYFGGFAPDIEQIKSSFKIGEGYVGACYKEGSTMQLTEINQTFLKVYSGLGEAHPGHLVFVPLKQDENKMGVIEIASFKKIDEYKIRFIEKLSENIASSLAINQANEKMHMLLEQSKIQARELQTREEELRQNLEEMHATQEDLNRQMESNKIMQQSLIKEKALLDSLMNSLPDYIYFKDIDSKFLRISKSMLPIFPVKNIDEMLGKSDFDFINKETAEGYYNEEQEIIKSGKGFVDKVVHEVFENGHEQWSSITKMPLIDETGRCIGTYGITKDINQIKKLELEAREKAEMLLAQEEELRQNLEEMQTIQEELQKQKNELAKEIALMNVLLSNAKESIYFKDEKSRFIKVSHSMAVLFKVKNVEELYGKTDFDFFTEEHARPAFEDEMNIIKTGKPMLDKIEKETHADGRITWVSTSKMPITDHKGKIIGTFGISKDVTMAKKMEMEIKEKNEELLAQEEELRQNLEEMQTIQEDLQKQKNELAKETALLNALLTNAKESIYFKDGKSRFIKVSKSLAALFKVKKPEELYGKSDFDFFTEEHARPAFEDEMNIIRTGKPMLDKIEKETHPDGRITWVTTSKMPLKESNGKIIGTFGISKDITDIKKMEMEIKERNEELQAQEEELRQNLEEMQTIQEDLKRRLDENEKMKKEFREKEQNLQITINKLQQELKQKKK